MGLKMISVMKKDEAEKGGGRENSGVEVVLLN